MNSSEQNSSQNKELQALIQLMDEPDENFYNQIRNRIISYGNEAIPYLEEAWSHSLQPISQKRIEILLHKLQFENIKNELSDWFTLGAGNLLLGYLIASKYQYPGLNEADVKKAFENIRMQIWLELNHDLTAMEKVKVFNKILFDVNEFEGDRKNYYSPLNTYINNVMESRKGNPLSLAMIFIILADMLDVPIFGVNLPDHFILAYMDTASKQPWQNIRDASVLFYINPFSGGAVFTKYEVEAFLAQMKLEPESNYFKPCSNVDIIIRLLQNLINSYNALGNSIKASELGILLKIFE